MLPMNESDLGQVRADDRGHRRRRASNSTSAARTACPSAAWARPSARCPSTSRWRPSGARSTPRMPVIVKLTPNVTNILPPAKAAQDGGADAVSLINTHQLDHARQLRHADDVPDHRRHGHARRLLRPGGQTDRAAHGGRDRAHMPRHASCRSPASAASPTGATRSTSWRSAPATCRSARRRWSTASRSSTT